MNKNYEIDLGLSIILKGFCFRLIQSSLVLSQFFCSSFITFLLHLSTRSDNKPPVSSMTQRRQPRSLSPILHTALDLDHFIMRIDDGICRKSPRSTSLPEIYSGRCARSKGRNRDLEVGTAKVYIQALSECSLRQQCRDLQGLQRQHLLQNFYCRLHILSTPLHFQIRFVKMFITQSIYHF